LEKEDDPFHTAKWRLCFGKKKEICRQMSKKCNIHLKKNFSGKGNVKNMEETTEQKKTAEEKG
jgi:hypothetical protein